MAFSSLTNPLSPLLGRHRSAQASTVDYRVPIPSSPDSSPLLALPLEILRQIIDYLTESIWPALALLRRAHRCFYNIISSSDVRDRPSRVALSNQLQCAGSRFPYLFPPYHYPYWVCLRVKPTRSFPDDVKVNGNRCCLRCGIVDRQFSLGRAILIDGIDHRHRRDCRERHFRKRPCKDLAKHLFISGRGIGHTLFISAVTLFIIGSFRKINISEQL